MLRREIGGIEGARILSTFARVVVAAGLMALVAWGVFGALENWLPGKMFMTQVVRLGVTIGSALLTLAIAAHVLGIPEFSEARDLIVGRFRRMSS